MIAILLFHTEKYYAGEEIIPYALYVDNAVMTFFFISGYLFYHPEKPFSVRHKLLSLFKSMFVPYLLFTSVIAFPKAFVHDDTTLTETLTAILTGHASWFIAALIVAELIFFGLLWLCHRRLWLLGFLCAIPYPLIAIAYRIYGETTMESMNYWCWQNALLMLLFLQDTLHNYNIN